MKECRLIVECFENGECNVKGMSYSKFKELTKDLNSMSANGYYEGENKSYIVLAVDNVVNNLVKFAKEKSIEALVNEFGFSKDAVEKEFNRI